MDPTNRQTPTKIRQTDINYRYLVKSPRHLVQHLATNLLNRGYWFYATNLIPMDKDPETVDAKLILTYDCHVSKSLRYRRKKAGIASVRYLRCGRVCVLVATKGESPYFEREPWRDARENSMNIAGYALRVDRSTGKVSVRLQRETQRRLRREWLDHASEDVREWERRIRDFPFMAFAGVRDNLFALLKDLNESRKLLREEKIDWRRCVRKKFPVEEVFEPSSPELLELLRHHAARGRSR